MGGIGMKSILIKDTTKEEREQIFSKMKKLPII